MASKSANPKNKLKRNRSDFKSASRTRSEECIWEIEGRSRYEKHENVLSSEFWLIEIYFLRSSRHGDLLSSNRKQHHLAGKEFVRIITRDGVRDLLVPSTKPNAYSEVWPERELSRLQANAKVMTIENKMGELKLRVEANEKLKQESEQRKQKLREIDTAKVAKMEDQKEAFVDEADNVKLLDRAFLAKQEQVN